MKSEKRKRKEKKNRKKKEKDEFGSRKKMYHCQLHYPIR